MKSLLLHDSHAQSGAAFDNLAGLELVRHYGAPDSEYDALQSRAALLDLSFRGRLVLTGADHQRFLHGQVTNDITGLQPGQGTYAALVTAKGKMVSDLHIYRLDGEILLDFEPGLTTTIQERLEKYIIADDVQVHEAEPHYGLLSIQGPQSPQALATAGIFESLPQTPASFVTASHPVLGEIYAMNHARTGSAGFDLFVPNASLSDAVAHLRQAAPDLPWCGWDALELARAEASIPRFNQDMDESNLAPETGIESRAISYSKGCYIGQEIIARIRTYGQVAKALRGIRLPDDLPELPAARTKLALDGREVGILTTAFRSPRFSANLAFGYVRREANSPGTTLRVEAATGSFEGVVLALPFAQNFA